MVPTDEFRRCLIEIDVQGMRRLWSAISPHLTQPATRDEALHTIHLARVEMKTLPEALKQYSREWLKERETRKIAHAVGIAVGLHSDANPQRVQQARNMRDAMASGVEDAIKAGVDVATEHDEIRRRMMAARARA